MNLEPTDEQQALRDTVRRFLAEKAPIADHARPMLTDATGTTDAVWHGLAALGTTALLIPAEYGGEGMSMLEAGVVLEELGAALHPGPWLSSAVAAPRALTRFGATTEAADLFGSLADGSTIATVAFGGDALAVGNRPDGRVLRGELDRCPTPWPRIPSWCRSVTKCAPSSSPWRHRRRRSTSCQRRGSTRAVKPFACALTMRPVA
jgi:hypothetical protein